MQSESSEYVRKTTGFFTNSWRIKVALESYFEKHAQDVWERNWMNPGIHTSLLNTCLPKMIATILKALRGQLRENDQLHSVEEIAGPVPEIPVECDQILKEGKIMGRRQRWVSARRSCVGRETWRNWLGTFWRCLRDCSISRVQRCRHETIGPNLGGHRKVWIRHARKFDRGCAQENTKRRSEVRFNELHQLFSCSLQCHLSKLWRCLFQSWCRWVCRTKGNHWSWDTTTLAGHISKEQPRDSYTSDYPQRIVRSMARTKLADWSRVCMELRMASHIWQLDHVNLICGELGGFGRGKHSAALFHNPIQVVRMAVHGDDFVCLSDDDGFKHIDSLLKSKYTANDMGTLGFEDSDVKKSSIVESGIQSGSWSNWTVPGYWTWFETRSTHHQWIGMQYEH